MSNFKVEDLLQEVSADLPCGEDLEYDPDFIALDGNARDKSAPMLGEGPGDRVDWAMVERQATAILIRTKDLRVALHLARAALNSEGLPGLRDGLRLVHGYLDRYWDQVHPQLDPADGLDPTQRINVLEGLSDPESFLGDLKSSQLIASKTFGSISLRDILVASGDLSLAGDSAESPPDMKKIDAAFLECDLDELRLVTAAAAESLQTVADIEAVMAARVDATKTPGFQGLTSCLIQISGLLREKLDLRAGDKGNSGEKSQSMETTSSDSDPHTPPSIGPIGQVKTREEVIRMLDMICDYYARNEPSSPVPLLLKRAKGLVAKEFMEILQDLVPGAVGEAERFRGSGGEDAGQ